MSVDVQDPVAPRKMFQTWLGTWAMDGDRSQLVDRDHALATQGRHRRAPREADDVSVRQSWTPPGVADYAGLNRVTSSIAQLAHSLPQGATRRAHYWRSALRGDRNDEDHEVRGPASHS